MPSLKEYNVKLSRLRSTRKLTRTMKLVSANKLRRAQEAEKGVAAYAERVQALLNHMRVQTDHHPLFVPRRKVRSVLLLAIASDRGLCGGFNNALFREAARWIAEREAGGHAVQISCCGRKAHSFFKSRYSMDRFYDQAVAHPDFAAARQVGHELIAGFLGGRLDEVHVASNRTGSRGEVTPSFERLIPVPPSALPAGTGESSPAGWLIEPDPATVLEFTLPTLISLRLYELLLASATGEHGARMRAMEQAGSNADSLIRNLTLQRNRARQAQITTELTEIVAGAEALR